jgi:hypothetical protein
MGLMCVLAWKFNRLLNGKKTIFPESGRTRIVTITPCDSDAPDGIYNDTYCICFQTPNGMNINYTASDKGFWSGTVFPYKNNTKQINDAIYELGVPPGSALPDEDFKHFWYVISCKRGDHENKLVANYKEGREHWRLPYYVDIKWYYDDIISIDWIDVCADLEN